MHRSLHIFCLAVCLVLTLHGGTALAATELVSNGGFETGDFTGWTLSGYYSAGSVGVNPYASTAHSGSNSAYLSPDTDNNDISYISQTLATTAGQHYLVSFWYRADRSYSNELFAYWGGDLLLHLTDYTTYATYPGGYTQATFDVMATGNSTTLMLGSRDSYYTRWDDISVTSQVSAVPVPAALWLLASGLGVLPVLRRRAA